MRVLVVLPDPVEADAIRQRCSALLAEGHVLAVCYVLASEPSLQASLDAQRKITSALRRALEETAETIPVFVVSVAERDGIDECARAWGAADVQT